MQRRKFEDLDGLKYLADIFFNLTVKEQELWAPEKLGVTARTFRNWCKYYKIETKKVSI
ncbi:TPA: hypothetical protein ACI4BV_000141 [Enterobacter hormaechei]